jgi:dUTP diphosphatase
MSIPKPGQGKPGDVVDMTAEEMKAYQASQPAPPAILCVKLREAEFFAPPFRSHEDDAGLDLTVSCWTVIHPGAIGRLQSNCAISLPPKHYGLIVPRSSALSEKGLLIQVGVIDPGYRGELITVVKNPTPRVIQVNEGERVSQLLVLPLRTYEVKMVFDLPAGSRGSAGFGASGGYLGS